MEGVAGFQPVVEEEQNLEHLGEPGLEQLGLQSTVCNIEHTQHNHLDTISINSKQILMLIAHHRQHKDLPIRQEEVGRNKQHTGQRNHRQMDLLHQVLPEWLDSSLQLVLEQESSHIHLHNYHRNLTYQVHGLRNLVRHRTQYFLRNHVAELGDFCVPHTALGRSSTSQCKVLWPFELRLDLDPYLYVST